MSDSGNDSQNSSSASKLPSQTSKLKKITQNFKKFFKQPISCTNNEDQVVIQCTKPGAFDVIDREEQTESPEKTTIYRKNHSEKLNHSNTDKTSHHFLETHHTSDDTKILKMIPQFEGLNQRI